MGKLSKNHFWEWFGRNQNEYRTLDQKTKKETAYWLNELNAHLRAYYKFLGYTLNLTKAGNAQLIITVYGKAQYFKKADDLVAKAPPISGWTIEALEPPRPVHQFLEQLVQESGIDPLEFSFSLAGAGPSHTVVRIYHPLCTHENEYLLERLAHAAIYNLLGERSFGNDIFRIEVANRSTADESEVQPLEALPESLGGRRSGLMIDSQGNLIMD